MKKQTLLFAALLCFADLLAQVAPPSVGTRWTYHKSSNVGLNGDFFTLQIVADSLIDGKICRKMTGGFGCGKLPSAGVFVHFSDQKAYQYDAWRRKFWLIYDWSAKVGDVVTVFVPQLETVDSFKIRIEEVSIWTPNGEPLRVQRIVPIGATNWLFATQQIIEKLGANAYFFPQAANCSSLQFGSLRCYEEPQKVPVKFVNYRCDSVIVRVRTSELFAERQIQLSPNPSVSELHLTFDAPIDGGFDVEIVNIFKQIVFKGAERVFSENLKIDVNNWQSGVYVVHLTDKNGGHWSRQFVKIE